MRGQDSEKQVHREGKTKADDENRPASGPSASSSAHQIRSRITVVCAECKRLKLKCDRRNPCGSCTKRDTVPRCIYSTAAAEKVDLHSLNNRLMQVESILAMVTAGQTPPPFQSSYPLAHIALPSPSTTSGQARSRTPLMSPISILLDDLKDIWLSNTHNLSEGENEGASGSSIKLEPLGMDNLLRLRESDMDPSEEIPRGLEPPTGLKVPPLQAYYLHPEGSASRSIPAASDALFALLPSALDRAKYVCCAINADPTLTMLTDWERIERAAQFPTHGNPHSSLGSSRPTRPTATATTGDNSQDTHMPIPIFVALIYAIAIGMLGQPDGHAEDSPSPTYLDELGSQALKVCQDYLLDGGAPRGGNIADGVNFVSANLLQFKFRLLSLRQKSASKAVSAEGLRSLFLSIGRLVNLGRSFGLAKEPSGDDDLSQIQRLLWWEILFYDAFISDALNQPPLISPSSYTTEIPKLSLPELVADGTTSAVEVITTEGVQVETQMTRSKSSKNTLDFGCYCGLHGKKHKEDISSMLKDRSRTALFAQSRLTRLLQYLREALAHTNCECCISNHGSGYTLDKATEVEVQIREFMDKLPSGLKLFPSPKIDQARPPWMAAIAAKVAILAHRMIIATYLPLMRPPIDENTGEPSRARTYAAQPWSSPNRTTLEAAQSVLAAADLLRRFKDFDSITRLVAFHPLSKAVFDALVICAHTGLGNGVGYSVNLIKITCEDVMKGLDLVPALGGLSSDMAQIVACIRQKVTNRPVSPIQDEPAIFDHGQSLKRKRHQPPSPTTSGDNQLSPSTETPAVASTPATGSPSGETDSDRPSQRRVSRIITELPSDQERSSRRELERYHPSVGVRNRGKGGPPWAKKLTPRHVSHANLEAAHLDDSSTMPLSRPVSSLSGSLEPAVSPRAPDSYMRYPIQQGLNSGMLPHEPSGHDYRPSSAHPHSEGDLEGRYRQRRRLSYDETAASNVSSDGSGFGQRGTFSNLLPGRNPAYVSLQGSIQGSIQISRPPASEVPYRDPPSHPRSVDDRAFHRMQQQAQPFTAREDHHFDTTLNLTAVLNPAGETVANKALAQVDDPPLYPGYRSSDQHSFDNPILTDPMQPSLVPVNPTPFSSGNQPQASQWSENFPSSFPLDDRSSQFWNADNYYQ